MRNVNEFMGVWELRGLDRIISWIDYIEVYVPVLPVSAVRS